MSKQKIAEATTILVAGNLAANVLQIVKLVITTSWFGASTGLLDQYFVALTIPLMFQGVVIGSLMSSFIPVYVGHVSEGHDDRARKLLESTFSFGLIFFFALCLILSVTARPLLRVAAGGFTGEQFELSVRLFRIFLVMLFCNGLCDLLTAFYNANKKYLITTIAPLLMISVSIIYLVLFRQQGVYALVYGLVLGSAIQFLFLLFGSRVWGGFVPRLSRQFLAKEFSPIYLMMLPIAASLAMGHTNAVVDQAVATRLLPGSVTILSYAGRLHEVVMKVFVMSLGGALLPFLSQYVAEKRFSELRSTYALGLRVSFITLLPIAILIWLFGTETIAVVFQRNEFRRHDSIAVGHAWTAYSIGLFATAAGIFTARCLNAFKDLHPLWMTTAISVPLNIVLDIWFARIWGVAGIALGTTCNYTLVWLLLSLRLKTIYRRTGAAPALLSPLWRSGVALLILLAISFTAQRLLTQQFRNLEVFTSADRAWALALIALAVSFSIAAYAIALKFLKVNEAAMLANFFGRFLKRKKSTAS